MHDVNIHHVYDVVRYIHKELKVRTQSLKKQKREVKTMKKSDQVITINVEGLGEITATMGTLNAISIAFYDSAELCMYKYPDLPGAAAMQRGYSEDIYQYLDAFGLYD